MPMLRTPFDRNAVFLFILLILLAFRFVLISDSEIVGAPADTEGLAQGVLCFQWRCGFDPLRPPGLSIAGAAARFAGLPWRLVLEVLFLVSVLVFARTVRRAFGPALGVMAAAAVLFHPYTTRSFTEFYREPAILCLYILLFASILTVLMRREPPTFRSPDLWLFSCLYAAIVFTREGEDMVLLPLLATVTVTVGWRAVRTASGAPALLRVLPALLPLAAWKAAALLVLGMNLWFWNIPDANGLFGSYKAFLGAVHRIAVDDSIRYAPATRQSFAVALRLSPTFAEFGRPIVEDGENMQILRLHSSSFVGRPEVDPTRTIWALHAATRSRYGNDDRLIRKTVLRAAAEIEAALDRGEHPARLALPYPLDPNWMNWLPTYPAVLWGDLRRMVAMGLDESGPAARVDYRPPGAPDLFDRALSRRSVLVGGQFEGWRAHLRRTVERHYLTLEWLLLAGAFAAGWMTRTPLSRLTLFAGSVCLAAIAWRIGLYAILSASVAPVLRYQVFAAPLFVAVLLMGLFVLGRGARHLHLAGSIFPKSPMTAWAAVPFLRPACAAMAVVPLGVLAIVAASVLYYRLYINAGFNVADEGHYAQVAYEFLLGTDPHAIRFSYGIAWFKIGQALFAVFEPSYALVRVLFFTLIGATSILLFATVWRVARNLGLALAVAAVAVLVPAFPATGFYAFCALLNVLMLVRAAERWRTLTPLGIVLPALCLSVAFQIRSDFGYLLAIPFAGVLLCAGAAGGLTHTVRLAGAALAAFLLGHLPLIADAVRHGYFDLVISEHARYVEVLFDLARSSFAPAPLAADVPAGAGTRLGRPPLSLLWTGSPAEALSAALLYAPVPVLAAYVPFQIWASVRAIRRDVGWPAESDRLLVRAVLLAGALVTFPHYFLYRPDLAHLANFMPGYMALAAVFAADMARNWRRPFGHIAEGALLATVGLYLWVGLTQPGTGSIAGLTGLTQRFTAQNGVTVRVTADEGGALEQTRQLIEAHTAPGERIVCVPFCPGVAFMTARRMLLSEFYVDDLMLIIDPGWIDRAIARTREHPPGVVITFDWAVNGTDISRFGHWAARYLAHLESAGYRRVQLPYGPAFIHPDR